MCCYLLQVLSENRKQLMDAGFTPGDPIPQEEQLAHGANLTL